MNEVQTTSALIANRKNNLYRNFYPIAISSLLEYSDNEVSRINNHQKEIHFDFSEKDNCVTIWSNGGAYMANIESFGKNYFNHNSGGANTLYDNSHFGAGMKNAAMALTNCIGGEVGKMYVGTMGIDGKYPKMKICEMSFKSKSENDDEEYIYSNVYDGDMEDEEICKKFHLSDGEEKHYGTTIILENVEKRLFTKEFKKKLIEQISKSYLLTNYKTGVNFFVDKQEVNFVDNVGILPIYDKLPSLTKEKEYFLTIDNIFYYIKNIDFSYNGNNMRQQIVYMYNYKNRLENARIPMRFGGLYCDLNTKFINCGNNDCEQFNVSDSRKGGLGNCNVYIAIKNDESNVFRFNIDKGLGIDPLKNSLILKECMVDGGSNLFDKINGGFDNLRKFNTKVAKGVTKGNQRNVGDAYNMFCDVMCGKSTKTQIDEKVCGDCYIMTSECYVVKNGKRIYKVGHTTNLKQRLSFWNNASPIDYQLEYRIKSDDCVGVEKYLHQYFSTSCTAKGKEFFWADDNEIFKAISEYVTTHNCQVYKGDNLISFNKAA